MSKTISITAANGAKVRTVHSKRYFVIYWGERYTKYVGFNFETNKGEYITLDPPEAYAKVFKRTDDLAAAYDAYKRLGECRAIYDSRTETFVELRKAAEFKLHKLAVARAERRRARVASVWH